MAESRQRADWGRTASLMALIANCHRDIKKHPSPFKPSHYSPFEPAANDESTLTVDRLADEIVTLAEAQAITSRRDGPTP